jgi:hypothetical protein
MVPSLLEHCVALFRAIKAARLVTKTLKEYSTVASGTTTETSGPNSGKTLQALSDVPDWVRVPSPEISV